MSYINMHDFFLSLVFHYQIKLHLFSQNHLALDNQPVKISLYGTHDEKDNIPIVV